MIVTCPHCDRPSIVADGTVDVPPCPFCSGVTRPSSQSRPRSPAHPYRPVRSPWPYALAVFAVTTLSAFLYLASTRGDSPIPLSFGPPEFALQSWQLVSAYEADSASADNAYKDRRLQVTGRVEKADWDSTPIRYVLLADEASPGVHCFFSKADDQFNDLKPGETVTIEGTCTGKRAHVILRDCSVAAH
jgi:hypothetical protein